MIDRIFKANYRELSRFVLLVGAILLPSNSLLAQGIVGGNTNLIVNGNAEAGAAGSLATVVASIPGWKRGSGNINVLPYGVTGYLNQNNAAPPDRGFQYFGDTGNTQTTATLTQDIDVSSASSLIGKGNIKYTASAYLGSAIGQGVAPKSQMQLDFKNGSGQIFSSAIVGPVDFNGNGIFLQQQIGVLPSGTALITVTLSLNADCPNSASCRYAGADSLSLVLSTLATTPVLGSNLIINGNAEAGSGVPAGSADTSIAPSVPGWSTNGTSVAPYGGAGWILPTSPGPSDRGVNLFCGWGAATAMFQDVDVTGAATMIDSGRINYQVGAWLGSLGSNVGPTLSYLFYDWNGKQLAPTAQLTSGNHTATALVNVSHSDVLPAGTRRVRITLDFPNTTYLADDISFSIGSLGAPVILPSGIVPVYSSSATIEPGSWVSVYGTGLASATTLWNGDFPTKLGDTTVTINSKPAYLWFVSPTQINLQAPDDSATGPVSVVVTTLAGSSTSTVTLGQYAPSFSLYNSKYAAAIVPTPGVPGNSGNGYDYIGPVGGLPFASRPVKAGETLVLYGVGFGPTNPPVGAGMVPSGVAPAVTLPTVTIGGVPATVAFAGIIQAGLFQLNVVVPSAGTGDKVVQASVGGVSTQSTVMIALQ